LCCWRWLHYTAVDESLPVIGERLYKVDDDLRSLVHAELETLHPFDLFEPRACELSTVEEVEVVLVVQLHREVLKRRGGMNSYKSG